MMIDKEQLAKFIAKKMDGFSEKIFNEIIEQYKNQLSSDEIEKIKNKVKAILQKMEKKQDIGNER